MVSTLASKGVAVQIYYIIMLFVPPIEQTKLHCFVHTSAFSGFYFVYRKMRILSTGAFFGN